jgi:hypothetical protein
MTAINGTGMCASFSITILTIDSNTAYSADVCTLPEGGCVQCYEHLICVADLKHICTPSLAVCVIGSWNSALKLKYLKCSAFQYDLPQGKSFCMRAHTRFISFAVFGSTCGKPPLVWCASRLSHCIRSLSVAKH